MIDNYVWKAGHDGSHRLRLPRHMSFGPTTQDFYIPSDDAAALENDEDFYDEQEDQEMPDYQLEGGQFGAGSSSAAPGSSDRNHGWREQMLTQMNQISSRQEQMMTQMQRLSIRQDEVYE